ncbi:LacI family DNA-binding transcriptional regulator [uncultured Sphaerochaeta sp.]|uniref:LacI family DNA-binding transcriptional regulator n=1 Tax=uncultured Sphaerochaeta sp. TaxID=886478 RepID=UPI002A0A2968|nr:LacI family DNA-binding transcriptional regulator [uncultured Sphaerochaeta sp.]
MVSIKEIAEKAGVSVSTVSRVINDKQNVNPEKRAKILQMVKATGYVPNRAARDMVMKRSFTVGIIIPMTFNMFQRQLFSDIEHHLEEFGYHSSFYFVAMSQESETACLRRLKGEKTDGVILLHEIELPEFHEYLETNDIPSVIATFEKEQWKATSIHISEKEAACAAVNHLIMLGHKEIALICGKRYSFGNQRWQGYMNALEAAGISYDEKNVVFVDSYSIPDGMAGMKELLDRKLSFSALFAITDELAIGAMRYLEDQGYHVPGDISVVGCDDIEISSYTIPRLTTIRQPVSEMGHMSVSMLHSLITSESKMNVNIALPFTLIERESTAKPKKAKLLP